MLVPSLIHLLRCISPSVGTGSVILAALQVIAIAWPTRYQDLVSYDIIGGCMAYRAHWRSISLLTQWCPISNCENTIFTIDSPLEWSEVQCWVFKLVYEVAIVAKLARELVEVTRCVLPVTSQSTGLWAELKDVTFKTTGSMPSEEKGGWGSYISITIILGPIRWRIFWIALVSLGCSGRLGSLWTFST